MLSLVAAAGSELPEEELLVHTDPFSQSQPFTALVIVLGTKD